MKLTYIFHSGFAIEGDGFTLICDFYQDVKGEDRHSLVKDYLLHRPGLLYVLSTHSHHDHFNPEILQWKKERPDIRYIFSHDILKRLKTDSDVAVYLKKLEIYKDEMLSIQAFGSTDIGGSFLIEVEGNRIFHAGDLNNWHWRDESTEEEIQKAEKDYLRELKLLSDQVKELDLAMFPVDIRMGTDYMRGAEQFTDAIKVKYFAPMHFGEEYASAAAFADYPGKYGAKVIRWSHKGESVEF